MNSNNEFRYFAKVNKKGKIETLKIEKSLLFPAYSTSKGFFKDEDSECLEVLESKEGFYKLLIHYITSEIKEYFIKKYSKKIFITNDLEGNEIWEITNFSLFIEICDLALYQNYDFGSVMTINANQPILTIENGVVIKGCISDFSENFYSWAYWEDTPINENYRFLDEEDGYQEIFL